jgi:rubrerythrin
MRRARFYRKAAERARDATVRELLTRLAEAEDQHENFAEELDQRILTKGARSQEDETARRMFVPQYVQPGLAGLMDGSVSTLAPLFAAAFATHSTWSTFLVGSPLRSAPASPWASPRHCPTTAR